MKDTQSSKIWMGVGKGSILLHHAYCLCGERSHALSELFDFLNTAVSFETRGNPDFFIIQCDTLTIDDSRRIKEIQSRKAFGERKILIAAFNSASVDAQNALLKVLEEPFPHTHFFIVIPRSDVLLPTLRSRVFSIELTASFEKKAETRVQEFLHAPLKERLLLVKSIASEVSDGNESRQFVIDFIKDLEVFYANNLKNTSPSVFKDLSLCRDYSTDQSASVKMLLEHLALVLPKV